MPSPAAVKYTLALERAKILRGTANDKRLFPISKDHKQFYYHASLAAMVAAWDAYINALVRDFARLTSNPLDYKYQAVHSILTEINRVALERFNTPNWENTRNLLVQHTGYDPYSDWIWPARNMGVQQVKERLNEILKVRHSFAHGFSIPNFTWTKSLSGRIRLTSEAIKDTEAFFNNIVRRTDKGISKHLCTIYGLDLNW